MYYIKKLFEKHTKTLCLPVMISSSLDNMNPLVSKVDKSTFCRKSDMHITKLVILASIEVLVDCLRENRYDTAQESKDQKKKVSLGKSVQALQANENNDSEEGDQALAIDSSNSEKENEISIVPETEYLSTGVNVENKEFVLVQIKSGKRKSTDIKTLA
ncbi:hypothetical protein HHI36_021629 [Cryptolaemus montrouzieri]|uniref:Uncharacterized protein n=1 Tax=Cryptolaemus montrouzieri TaxID=559131 RepID=A0ABD2MY48_9CUCU